MAASMNPSAPNISVSYFFILFDVHCVISSGYLFSLSHLKDLHPRLIPLLEYPQIAVVDLMNIYTMQHLAHLRLVKVIEEKYYVERNQLINMLK